MIQENSKSKILIAFIVILISALLVALGFLISNSLSLYKVVEYERDVTPTPLFTRNSVALSPAVPVIEDGVTPSPTPLLFKNGSVGDEVKKIQERLKVLSYYDGVVDGQFGNGTKNSIIWFQKQHGLNGDGLVGPTTYNALFDDNAQVAKPTASPTLSPTPAPTSQSSQQVNYLLLVNKSHALDKNYVPENLIKLSEILDTKLIKIKYKSLSADKQACDALNNMIKDANNDGLKVWQVSSAYRSIKDQADLFNSRKKQFMKEGMDEKRAINSTKITVAEPRTSEHHTGLAFDITVPDKFFKDTKQSLWLSANCWKYGFIIRYEKDKEGITGFIAEPWHIRYVGLPHSINIRDQGLCLEEYLQQQGLIDSIN